jgi:hypothetical protein
MRIANCKYAAECRVHIAYPELCYLNMSDRERVSLGNSCPVADEYKLVPEEPVHNLVCPSGLMKAISEEKPAGGLL